MAMWAIRGRWLAIVMGQRNFPSSMPIAPVSQSDLFQRITGPLAPAFERLEAFLEDQVAAFEPEVQDLVRYCFGHSGKKLRPILVFLSGLDEVESGPSEGLIKAAAIVELVHLATLVHDDILDGADLRHRTETVFARYGSHVSVLLGDALFAHALHLAADFPEVTVCREVSRATRQVCSGEIAQTFARGDGVPSMDAYYRMIDLKTAELFAVSSFLGAHLAGLSAEAARAARAFARHLGIAYQIYDDAADLFGREAQAGKTLGTDLATGKLTLPILLWLEGTSGQEREAALALLADGHLAPVRAQLEAADIPAAVQAAFLNRIALAREEAERLPGPERTARLQLLCDFIELSWNKFRMQ